MRVKNKSQKDEVQNFISYIISQGYDDINLCKTCGKDTETLCIKFERRD